jgi:hypothetical protein
MVNARNEVPHGDRGHRVVAISNTGGSTWEPFYYSEPLIDPTCMAGLINHNHDLFFSNPASETIRSHMTVKRSHDQGASWAPIAMIDAGPSGYSNLVSISNHTVGCVYENEGVCSAPDGYFCEKQHQDSVGKLTMAVITSSSSPLPPPKESTFLFTPMYPVLVGNSSKTLLFPMLTHKFTSTNATGTSTALLLRVQTSADTDCIDTPCTDATFISYDNASSWTPGPPEIQKRLCFPYPLDARDRVLCIRYASDVCPAAGADVCPQWTPADSVTPACQARADAFCNNASQPEIKGCIANMKQAHNNATAILARFDRSIHGAVRAWRCYSR